MISTPSDKEDDVDFEQEDDIGAASASKQRIAKLRDDLEAAKRERQEYLDGWQRAKADLINERREHLEATRRAGENAIIRLVDELVPALDSFDMAMRAESWNNVDSAWRVGMESVCKQIESALAAHGITPFGAVDEPFDANRHEIASETDAPGTAGTVASIVRRGWKLNDRVIRPAHVVLFRAAS